MLRWNGGQAARAVKESVMAAAVQALFDPYVLLLRQQIATLGPPPSLPGEPPHSWPSSATDPQSLVNTMYIWPLFEEGVVHVGSTEPHALYLEMGTQRMAARPLWVGTLVSVLDTLATVLAERAADNFASGRAYGYPDGVNANPLTVEASMPGAVAEGRQRSLSEG